LLRRGDERQKQAENLPRHVELRSIDGQSAARPSQSGRTSATGREPTSPARQAEASPAASSSRLRRSSIRRTHQIDTS
jgi:hypothetical protein